MCTDGSFLVFCLKARKIIITPAPAGRREVIRFNKSTTFIYTLQSQNRGFVTAPYPVGINHPPLADSTQLQDTSREPLQPSESESFPLLPTSYLDSKPHRVSWSPSNPSKLCLNSLNSLLTPPQLSPKAITPDTESLLIG